MLVSDRRKFLRSSAATALSLAVPADLFAQAASAPAPDNATWDAGGLRHLLPTVSVGGTSVRGRMGDTHGEHWHFYVTDLEPQPDTRCRWPAPRAANCASPGSFRPFPVPTIGPTGFVFCFTPAAAATKSISSFRPWCATGCCDAV